MLSFIISMAPFLLPFFLGVILVGGLWVHDRAYRRQEIHAGAAKPLAMIASQTHA